MQPHNSYNNLSGKVARNREDGISNGISMKIKKGRWGGGGG